MYQKVNFLRISKVDVVDKFHFEIVISEDHSIFFYTYNDISGFGIVNSLTDEELMVLAVVCLKEKESLRRKVDEMIKLGHKKQFSKT